MQGSNQTEGTKGADTKLAEQSPVATGTVQSAIWPSSSLATSGGRDFDWLALGVVLLLAALFAVAGRLNSQPPTSLVPAAVLSATGCGLLATAIRKLHTSRRPGLFEASIGGFFLALFQFMAALTYPRIFYVLSLASDERLGFLTTWGMIVIFSVVFSIVGALLGHIAFAPLRSLPTRNTTSQFDETNEEEDESLTTEEKAEENDFTGRLDEEQKDNEHTNSASKTAEVASAHERVEVVAPITPANFEDTPVSPLRSGISYFISILLLGLFPTLVGYIFAAAFDYMQRVYSFFPGPYPTLRLLSALLPWQLPVIINLNSNDPNAIIFLLWQLWRIPLFLGNPTMFDTLALEPLVFNAAGLSLLLLTMRNSSSDGRFTRLSWSMYLLLEILLGFILILPADLWIFRGLQGLLQEHLIVMQIRTLHILDTPTFLFNLITGPLVCLTIGIALRFLQKKWTLGRQAAENSK